MTAEGSGAAARAVTGRVLGLVQEFLAQDVLAGSRLAVVTRGAVAAGAGEGAADLAGAAAWGLVRSAQTENPGRLVLADLPAAADRRRGMMAAVLAAALESGEPELAVRGGGVLGRGWGGLVAGWCRRGAGCRGGWTLPERGTLDGLALVACPEAGGAAGGGSGAGGGAGGGAEFPGCADRRWGCTRMRRR